MAPSPERTVSASASRATHLKQTNSASSRRTNSSNVNFRIASHDNLKAPSKSMTQFGTMDLVSGVTLFWNRLNSPSPSSTFSNYGTVRNRRRVSVPESRLNCSSFSTDGEPLYPLISRPTSSFSPLKVTQKMLPFTPLISNASVNPSTVSSLERAYEWMKASKPSSIAEEESKSEVLLEVTKSSEEIVYPEQYLQSKITKRSSADSMKNLENYSSVEAPESNQIQQQHAAQKHACAGAFAGTFVSVCLHPMDTVKTFLQSRNAHKQPAFSFITERGLLGLYRGLFTKITCSAPISGIYTVTYESTKNIIFPHMSKDYYSFAHSIAGACASVATSFLYTPSEHVKQQMQIGLHYPNCWTAVNLIIRKGGFIALYTGWGAVLCRNIPHSAIKFCAYEKVKDLMGSPNTLQTIICGGIAGSVASFFTTPFDVVKTRLQTPRVGCAQYDGVFHALTDIAKSEGLRGLFRGLIPRIVMYMSQGALFFSSYECVKEILL